MDRINTLHATIKFTCSYNIKDRSTTFLDTLVTLTDSDIATDLYRKPTDRVQYLLPSSCHPAHIGKTGRTFHDRIREHMYDIKKGKKTSGLHYKSEGHVHLDFKVQIIEKVTPNTEFHRLEREEYWIKKFVTKTPFGLNIMT